jgi:hypothetical protein
MTACCCGRDGCPVCIPEWAVALLRYAEGREDYLDFRGCAVPPRIVAMVRAAWPLAAILQDRVNAEAEQ